MVNVAVVTKCFVNPVMVLYVCMYVCMYICSL
jgi:hypothetical protein